MLELNCPDFYTACASTAFYVQLEVFVSLPPDKIECYYCLDFYLVRDCDAEMKSPGTMTCDYFFVSDKCCCFLPINNLLLGSRLLTVSISEL